MLEKKNVNEVIEQFSVGIISLADIALEKRSLRKEIRF